MSNFLENLNTPPITSIHNQLVRRLATLYKVKDRKEQGLTLLEGFKVLDHVLKSGTKIQDVLFERATLTDHQLETLEQAAHSGALPTPVSREVLERLSKREGPLECIATAPIKKTELTEISPKNLALIVIAEGIEKPGNLGVLIRSTNAAAADAFISVDSQGDAFDPASVNSSLGSVFTTPVVTATTEECIKWLTLQGIPAFVTTPNAQEIYYNADLKGPLAIVVGSEHRGVSERWLKFGKQIKIPMSQTMESLNATVAGPVVIFEALRQRIS